MPSSALWMQMSATRGVQNRVPGQAGSENLGSRFFGYLKLRPESDPVKTGLETGYLVLIIS